MMLNLNDVLSEWEFDSQLDKVLIDESALKIACLHQKYLVYLNQFKSQKRELTRRKKAFPAADRRLSSEYQELEELLAQQDDGIDYRERGV